MTTEIERASEELAEELKLTPAQWAEMAEEYRALGESIETTRKRRDSIADALRQHIAETGEGIWIEGVGTLEVKERRYGYDWHLTELFEQHPEDFWRLYELRALTVDGKTLDAAIARGDFTGPALREPFRTERRTTALQWDKRRA